ncbi:MAG: helix-turn-helix transcriptional regulator [Bacteroidota bacterium]
MTEISDKYWITASDKAIIEAIGSFIKHHRVQQNKSQSQLAKESGIVRSTLSLFERGQNTSLIIFVQLLRALKLLHLLQEFQVKQQISPIQLAKIEQSRRIRARRKDKNEAKPKSTW